MASVLEPRTDLELVSNGDELLYEIVDGQRVDLPPIGILSNLIAARLYAAILNHLKRAPHGTIVMEALLILDEQANLRRRPVVAFVSAERWPLDREIPETGDWSVVPDLAVEVTSPHDHYGDVVGKVQEYLEHGVREVWVVEPEHRVVHIHSSPTGAEIRTNDQSLETPLLPGLTIPLADVFARRPVPTQALER